MNGHKKGCCKMTVRLEPGPDMRIMTVSEAIAELEMLKQARGDMILALWSQFYVEDDEVKAARYTIVSEETARFLMNS